MLKKLKIVLDMVKIEHTIFALPFAFMGAFLAARGLPRAAQIGWILLAMVGARSAAMAFNRLVDLPFDARNPRTSNRALPKKLVSRGFVVAFIVASSAVFIVAASQLNRLSLELSPLALGIIFLYSFTKRFTWLTHLFLGVSLACAPIGAWIAVKGSIACDSPDLGARSRSLGCRFRCHLFVPGRGIRQRRTDLLDSEALWRTRGTMAFSRSSPGDVNSAGFFVLERGIGDDKLYGFDRCRAIACV